LVESPQEQVALAREGPAEPRLDGAAAVFGAAALAAVAGCAAAMRGATARGGRQHARGNRSLVACAAEAASSEPAPAAEAAASEPAPAEGEQPADGEDVIPDVEDAANGSKASGAKASAEKAKPKEEPKPKAKKWFCSSCGSMNFANSAACQKCDAKKPSKMELDLMEAKIAAQDQVGKVMDQFIRLQADLANYRREHGEAMQRTKSAGQNDALRKIVPFTKEIDKALVPPENMTEKEAKLFQSYTLLFRKIGAVWGKFGVAEQEVEVGSKFDPNIHRKAESREVEGDQTPGSILEVLEAGWTADGKVLVPSEVAIVAFPGSVAAAESKKEEEEEDVEDDSETVGEEEPVKEDVKA